MHGASKKVFILTTDARAGEALVGDGMAKQRVGLGKVQNCIDRLSYVWV